MRAVDVKDDYRMGNAVDDIFLIFYKGNQGLWGIPHSPREQYHTAPCKSTAPGGLLGSSGAQQQALQFI